MAVEAAEVAAAVADADADTADAIGGRKDKDFRASATTELREANAAASGGGCCCCLLESPDISDRDAERERERERAEEKSSPAPCPFFLFFEKVRGGGGKAIFFFNLDLFLRDPRRGVRTLSPKSEAANRLLSPLPRA